MGLPDKTHLARNYGACLGRAVVTGYCNRFKVLRDLDAAVLDELFRDAALMAQAAALPHCPPGSPGLHSPPEPGDRGSR